MGTAYNDYKNCVSNTTGLPPGPERDRICGVIVRRSASLCHSCCADGGCNYGTCQEQNGNINCIIIYVIDKGHKTAYN